MKKNQTRPPTRKSRRVFRLQRHVRYAGTKPGPAPVIFSLCVPRDIVEELGLSKGDRYHFLALGGILTYEPMGAE